MSRDAPPLMENGARADAARKFRALLVDSRVVVCVGSGGVGKTTTAAATAIAAARQGRRCAVLTIDPARRLAQALGMEAMGNTPRALPASLVAPGSVDAMMLKSAEAFDDLIRRLVPDPERQSRLLSNRLYQVLARHLGGTHEYMAVDKLYELSRSDAYDLVVVDTPPSVNALDFLDAPRRISSFFSEKIQRFFIRRSDDQKKGLIRRLRDRAGEMALGLLGKALGDGFIEDVQDFATAFQGLFGAFRERGIVIEALMSSPTTSFVVVTGADPVRVSEAVEFSRALSRLDITPRAYIANRVHLASTDAVATLSADQIRASWPDAPTDPDALAQVAAELRVAQAARAALSRRDREGLTRLLNDAKDRLLLVVPELDDEVQDRSAVEHLVTSLIGPSGETPPPIRA